MATITPNANSTATATATATTTSEKSYTSSVSDDSSYLTWIKHHTTNGAFSILYAMVDGNIFPKFFIIISTLIEFIELLSFSFYRDYFPWPDQMKFMSKLYMIINQTPLSSYPVFTIFFWVSQAIFYLAIFNTLFMAYQFHRKNFTYIFPIKTLRIFVAGLVTFLVIPLVSLWSISFNCHSGNIIHFPSNVSCYGTQNVISIGLSILSLLILVPYAAITCSTYFEMDPHVTNTFSRMNARYELALLGFKIFLTLFFQLAYTSNITLAIVLFISLLTVLVLSIVTMPFYNHTMNQFRTTLLSMTVWASICLLITISINNTKNMTIVYLFFIGLVPSFLFGFGVIEWRKRYLLKRVEQFKVDKESWKKFVLSGDYEVVSRYLIGDPNASNEKSVIAREKGIEIMNDLYTAGLKLAPDSSTILKSYCYFLKVHKNDQAQSHVILERLKATKPWWDIHFFVYHQERARERANEANGVGADQNFKDFMVYVEFKRLCSLSRRNHLSALRSINKFWTIAASKSARQLSVLSRQGAHISKYEHKANSYYKRLLEMHPNSSRIMRDYALFVEDVMNDKNAACELLDRAAKIEEEQSLLSHPPLPDTLVLGGDTPDPLEKKESQISLHSSHNMGEESTLENLPDHPLPQTSFHRTPSTSSTSSSSGSSLPIPQEVEMDVVNSTHSSPSVKSTSATSVDHHSSPMTVNTKLDMEVKRQNKPIRRLNIILILATVMFVVCTISIFIHLFIRLTDVKYEVMRLRITGSYVVTASNIAFYMRSSQVAAQAYQKSINDTSLFKTALNQSMTLERRSVQLLNLHNAIYEGERTIYNYDRDHYKLVTGHPVTWGLDTGSGIFDLSTFNRTKYRVKKGSDMYSIYQDDDILTYTEDSSGNFVDSKMYSIYDMIPERVYQGINMSHYLPNDTFWQGTVSNNDYNFKWVTDNTKNLANSLMMMYGKWLGSTQKLMEVLMLVNIGITLAVIVIIVVFNLLFVMPVVNSITKKKMNILRTFSHVPKNISEKMASISLKKLYLLENEIKQSQQDQGTFETPTMIDSSDGNASPTTDLTINTPRKTIQFAPTTESSIAIDLIGEEEAGNQPDNESHPAQERRNSVALFFSRLTSSSQPQKKKHKHKTSNDLLKQMRSKLTKRMHFRYLVPEIIVVLMIIAFLLTTSGQIKEIREKAREVYLSESQATYIRMILYYAQEIIYNPTKRVYMQESIKESVAAMRNDFDELKKWRSHSKMTGPDYFFNTRDCLRKLEPCLKPNDTYYDVISQGLENTLDFYLTSAMNLSAETNASKLTGSNYYWGYIKMESKSDLYDGSDNYAYQIGFQLLDEVSACLLSSIIIASIFSVVYFVLYFIFFHRFIRELQFESKNTISMLNMIPKYD